MANPASITVLECLANSAVNQAAAQAVDTDGTINLAAGGKMGRLILEIINLAAVGLTVTIKAGIGVQAHQAKDLAVSLAATGGATAKRMIGPFESSRFMKSDGSIDVAFLAASSTPNATVRAYRLPKGY